MATVTGARGEMGAGFRSARHLISRLARWAPTCWPWRRLFGHTVSDQAADAQAWLGAEAYVNPPPFADQTLAPPGRGA
jgi:hypothetical protein